MVAQSTLPQVSGKDYLQRSQIGPMAGFVLLGVLFYALLSNGASVVFHTPYFKRSLLHIIMNTQGTENKIDFPILQGTYLNRYSTAFESDLLVNAGVFSAQSQNARSPALLVPRLGKQAVADVPNASGSYYSNTLGVALIVTDAELRAYSPFDWSYAVLKTFDPSKGSLYPPLFEDTYAECVVWTHNQGFYRLAKKASGSIQVFDIDTTNLAGGDFTSISFTDGYLLCSLRNTRQFIRSELNGALFSDALNFSATQSNDQLVNLAVLNREVYLFCDRHTEVWWDAASDPDQPFVRQDGRIYPIGIVSENTVHLNGALYNAGAADDNTSGIYSWTAQGYSKISFDLLDYHIQNASNVRLFGSMENNQTLIHVVIDGDETWTYCVDTKQWYQRQSWPVSDLFSIRGQFYGIDEAGVFKIAGNTDRGVAITCTKQCPVQHANELLVFFNLLEFDVMGSEHGRFQLQLSDDGGATWRNAYPARQSVRGSYTRVRFERLGSSRSRVFKVLWTGASIAGAFLDAELGTK